MYPNSTLGYGVSSMAAEQAQKAYAESAYAQKSACAVGPPSILGDANARLRDAVGEAGLISRDLRALRARLFGSAPENAACGPDPTPRPDGALNEHDSLLSSLADELQTVRGLVSSLDKLA